MTRIVDLTRTLRPDGSNVDVEPKFLLARDGWNGATWRLYSHAGTHMDAPMHFGAGDGTIDCLPLTSCMGPAWIVRLPGTVPRALIGVADLGPVADALTAGESLLLHTGWSRHADNPELFRNGLPRIAEDLAAWCVERKVRILGVEPPSVADVNNLTEVTHIHRALLEGGVGIVEGLVNLDQVEADRVFFAALPLKLGNGDGAPVRAFAIEGIPPTGWIGRHTP